MSEGPVLKGHWRTALGFKFLAAEDLLDSAVTLTIDSVTQATAYDKQAKKEITKATVWFKETDRGLMLNTTKARAIAEIVDARKVEAWEGKKIKLTWAEEKHFGKHMGVIKVIKP